jgi:ribosome-associated toxin RatA of RatAB toxin-antitoxin module
VKSLMRMHMEAPPERIFALAADVERWPQMLPHYRYVRRLQAADGERRFAMGARRGPIPVRWQATQRPMPERGVIEFTHTGGVTRGMQVAWRLVPAEGGTDVSIEHELRLGGPLIGELAASRIIGPVFVDAIAGRTLRRMKQLAEADR